jgi:hypothetical protein
MHNAVQLVRESPYDARKLGFSCSFLGVEERPATHARLRCRGAGDTIDGIENRRGAAGIAA